MQQLPLFDIEEELPSIEEEGGQYKLKIKDKKNYPLINGLKPRLKLYKGDSPFRENTLSDISYRVLRGRPNIKIPHLVIENTIKRLYPHVAIKNLQRRLSELYFRKLIQREYIRIKDYEIKGHKIKAYKVPAYIYDPDLSSYEKYITSRGFKKPDIIRKLIEQGNKCLHCEKFIEIDKDAEGDHIIPDNGKNTEYSNLQVLCMLCNKRKKNRSSVNMIIRQTKHLKTYDDKIGVLEKAKNIISKMKVNFNTISDN